MIMISMLDRKETVGKVVEIANDERNDDDDDGSKFFLMEGYLKAISFFPLYLPRHPSHLNQCLCMFTFEKVFHKSGRVQPKKRHDM